jgi:hypothetical protein
MRNSPWPSPPAPRAEGVEALAPVLGRLRGREVGVQGGGALEPLALALGGAPHLSSLKLTGFKGAAGDRMRQDTRGQAALVELLGAKQATLETVALFGVL